MDIRVEPSNANAAKGRWSEVEASVSATGLATLGALSTDLNDRCGALVSIATIVLVGFKGRRGWEAFSLSREALEGAPDPLDRWSRRVVGALASELGATALFPFCGPPHLPFQSWALRAGGAHVSPLGLLIHPEHGLWLSYRGALGFAEPLDAQPAAPTASPCESCAAKPCLSACPVGAFRPGAYDVEACAAHLRSQAGDACMRNGCLARRACPIGAENRHGSEQAAFHMRAFLKAREKAHEFRRTT